MQFNKPSDFYRLFISVYILLIILSFLVDPFMVIYIIGAIVFPFLVYFIYLEYHILVSYFGNMFISYKQKKLINSIAVIPYYEPPSEIHPAVAGYLVDKQSGRREWMATLIYTIINGYIAIDERLTNGKYKYYLIKNKGFCGNNIYDRFISDYLFNSKDNVSDIISFNNISTDMWDRNQFTKNTIIELINLKYFIDPYKYKHVYHSGPIEPAKYIEVLESKFNNCNHSLKQKEKQERKDFEYYKLHYRGWDNSGKNLNKLIHPVLKDKDSFTTRPMAYTQLGAEERAKWLGFKNYLQTAERFRMDVEQVETFSKYLPYAIALGVETKWAKRFEDMDVNRLEWFRSQDSETIKRHDSQKVYFNHLVEFLGQIYVK